ncbi:L-threonylcarbamoyladenylate synthase [Sansalvadorimonas sp. 2012CJ34-2]|uniref:L-threonylcarbamoyladenylate synthase n=1 Tax=Parendozoicomonas callyspongiae TaxID=2942213 RepID=A0ABT0PI55_9GAMM|nr:L-threonylcarbamoyladenylate synthase [Sansalvadorimonas sp. 2012CJ34-2]
MSQFFQIHPDNPQVRLIRQAVAILDKGGVIVYPTDSAYALGCRLGDKKAVNRIRRIRHLDERHNLTLVCRDLSELATYAKVGNSTYRSLKAATPGAYTFILNATSQVPRLVMHPKRRTIGIRVPDNKIVSALLEELGEPLLSSTLHMPGDEFPLTDPYDIRATLENQLDLIIDGGFCGMEPTTVVSLVDDSAEVWREGKGDPNLFQ